MSHRPAIGTLSPELRCKEHGAFHAPCIGIQVVDEEGDLALANCPVCASTLAWEIPSRTTCHYCGDDIEPGFVTCAACRAELRLGETVDQYLDEVAAGVIDAERRSDLELVELGL